jgi:hypothetical protein
MNYSLRNEVEGVKAVWGGGGFRINHYFTLHSGGCDSQTNVSSRKSSHSSRLCQNSGPVPIIADVLCTVYM